MTTRTNEAPQNNIPLKDKLYFDNRYKYGVPVDLFIDQYNVTSPEVQTTLREHPTLCYLLGKVTPEPQTQDSRPDNVMRPVYFLTEGSGMFGLDKKDDSARWKGIFNHVLGTARQVYTLAAILKNLTPQQQTQFGELGFDVSTFKDIDPELLRDFMLISHARRREADEREWHKLKDAVHQESDPGTATLKYLTEMKASPTFIDLMRVEMHTDHLGKMGEEKTYMPNLVDNLLTYCDWTFGQSPNILANRFEGLRKSQRADPQTLDLLELFGNNFEAALNHIVSPNAWEVMTSTGPYDWETQIRQTYCTPSGLILAEAFPGYAKQFPQLSPPTA